MKFFNIAIIFALFILACSLSTSFAQEDGPKRPAARRPVGKSAKTTTTAPPPPAEEEAEYGDENPDQYGDEGEEDSGAGSSTTSTEPPKKIGPVIRPFRSNDDFLNSLKRRQMDAKKTRAEKAAPKSRPQPVADDADEGEESAPAPAPAKGFKGGNAALNRRKLTKAGKPEPPAEDAAAEESEQQQKEDPKARRPIGRLALRKQ